MIDLGTLGNGFVHNSHDNGGVVGFAENRSFTKTAFLWRQGVMTSLGTLGRTSYSMASNSRSQVVGASRIDDTPGNFRAFLWENGGPLVDLNTLIPRSSTLTLVWAVNINDRGEIAGLGVPAGCQPADYLLCGHAFLLTPDGDCDGNCQNRVAQSQVEAELRRLTAPTQVKHPEPPVRSAEDFRSMMRQRFGLPGARPTSRD